MLVSFVQCPVQVLPSLMGFVTLAVGLRDDYVEQFLSVWDVRSNEHSRGIGIATSFFGHDYVLYSVSSVI